MSTKKHKIKVLLCFGQTHLLVRSQCSEQRNDIALDVIQLQHFGKLAQLRRSGTADHRSIVRAKVTKVPKKEIN